MAAKLAHVSLFKRVEQDGTFHGGGVEKFAEYLKRCFPEMGIFSLADCTVPTEKRRDVDRAEHLNTWLLDQGLIDKNTVVIGDGFWVHGLEGEVARLVSICHGSYWGMALEHEREPWGDTWIGDWALDQERIWKQAEVEVVAISKRSAQELETTCGVLCDAVIPHGIDLEIYVPGTPVKDKILHVAVSERKSASMVAILSRFHEEYSGFAPFDIEQLGYAKTFYGEADLWKRGEIFLAPTKYEGNSYALLEAMACGLIPVAYKTGYVFDLPDGVAETTDDCNTNNFAQMLGYVMENKADYIPREYAEEYFSLQRFSGAWEAYLNA